MASIPESKIVRAVNRKWRAAIKRKNLIASALFLRVPARCRIASRLTISGASKFAAE